MLIRLAEMYFIVMEATSSTTEANGLFSEYASSRGIATADLSSNKLRTLTKEFNKEFYAEGQMFFFYKLEIEVLEFSDRIWYSKATGKRENLKRKEKR